MANYWMHNGFLQVEGEKMAKSAGNFVTIRDLRQRKKFGGRRWPSRVIRFAMLQAQYRQPIDWSVRLLEQSEVRLERWRDFAAERISRRQNNDLLNEFLSMLADDLNTPAAFAVVDRALNREQTTDADRYTVYQILRLLGLRAKRSRVAQTAEHFRTLRDAVQGLSEQEWSHALSESQLERVESGGALSPETQLLIFLDALTDYWDRLRVESDWSKQFWPELSRQDESELPRRRALQTINNSLRYFLELGHYSKNDWNNFFATATQQTRFKSSNLKPETSLLIYIDTLATTWRAVRPRFSYYSLRIRELKGRLLADAKPADSDFELQVRRLIADRQLARDEKRYSDADKIRNQLLGMGVVLKDSKDGTTWEISG
jgi:hypothetical protein